MIPHSLYSPRESSDKQKYVKIIIIIIIFPTPLKCAANPRNQKKRIKSTHPIQLHKTTNTTKKKKKEKKREVS
jgi:hypothetical protein